MSKETNRDFNGVAEETMTGDLMQCLIDEIKHAPDVWPRLSESEQRELIYRVQSRVQVAIMEAVHIIASADRPTIVATIESVTVKDGIKAVLTIPKTDEQRHELYDATGQAVLLVVAGTTEYQGGTDSIKPDPDQLPMLGLGERYN